MPYPIELKNQAISLRKKGFSLKEVSEKLDIAKSTASSWLQNINLNQKAQERLKKLKILGQYKSRFIKKIKRDNLIKDFHLKAYKEIHEIHFDKNVCKLFCALLYWCEGAKTNSSCVKFINSDPKMVFVFLKLLRISFKIDEQKFRARLHLHDYHNEAKQKKFWSKIIKIPIKQFNKSYQKPNTKIRIRAHYPGCITISYYGHLIAKELAAIYNVYASI